MSMIRSWVTIIAFLLCAAAFAGDPVNINTADAALLAQAIKGVGIKRAEAIVAYREQHGPFKSIEELTAVQGVGVRIVETSRHNLTVAPGDG